MNAANPNNTPAPPSAAHAANPRWISLVVLLCYGFAVTAGYTFDDTAALLMHPAVNGDAPWWEVFTREFWGRPLSQGWSSSYRPLTTLTFALEHRLTGAPWLHHAVNVGLYAVLCQLVFRYARTLTSGIAPWVAALWFAVMPIHSENVASIVGRADVLAACLGLGALLVGRSGATWGRAALAGALYLAALLCKETVALLPGLLLLDVPLRWRRGHGPNLASARGAAIVSLTGVAYILWRQLTLPVGLPGSFIPADNVLIGLHGHARWWANLDLLGGYLSVAVAPAKLCADHTFADVLPPQSPLSADSWRAWLGGAAVVWIIVDAFRGWRGRDAGHALRFAVAYLLVGQWVVDLSVIFAERIFLWPSIFLVIPAGHAVSVVWERQPQSTRKRLALAGAALALLLGARTASRTLDWRSPLTLHVTDVATCPAALHNRLHAAKALQAAGEQDRALWHYAVALAGRQRFPRPLPANVYEAERTLSLLERLRSLPTLLPFDAEERLVWPALVNWLRGRGALREAALAETLGRRAANEARP